MNSLLALAVYWWILIAVAIVLFVAVTVVTFIKLNEAGDLGIGSSRLLEFLQQLLIFF